MQKRSQARRPSPTTSSPGSEERTRVSSRGRLRVQLGAETIQPVQFNSYQIGAVEMEVELESGDDPVEVFRRVHAQLVEMQDEAAPLKFDQWRRHWKEAKARS